LEQPIDEKSVKRKNMKQQTNSIDRKVLANLVRSVERQKLERKSTVKPALAQSENQRIEPKPKQTGAKTPAAFSKKHGEVLTQVWANKTEYGAVEWRVSQCRIPYDGAVWKNFAPENILDAVRGLCDARAWIRKTERRLRWRRLWF